MIFEFDYNKAIDRCKKLSSFEGRDAIGGSGENIYLSIKITDQDVPLLKEFFNTAALVLEESCAKIVVSSDYNNAGFIWNLNLDTRRWNEQRNLNKYVEEAIVSFAMMKWLEERKSERKNAYVEIWEDMFQKCTMNLFRLRAPIKHRRFYKEINDIEIIDE